MKINLVFLILTLAFFSCKEKKTESTDQDVKHQPMEIDLSKKEMVHENILSQIFDFQFLKLKGIPPNEFIIEVDKVIEHDKKLFVLDRKKSNLLVFTSAGDFLQKIGERGGGPEEYTSINDFLIHKKKNEIILLGDRHMLFFDSTGAFKNKIAFRGFYPTSFSLLNDAHLVFNVRGVANNNFYGLVITDINGEIMARSSKFPQSESYINFAFTGGMTDHGTDIYYNVPTSSLIYKVIPPAQYYHFIN